MKFTLQIASIVKLEKWIGMESRWKVSLQIPCSFTMMQFTWQMPGYNFSNSASMTVKEWDCNDGMDQFGMKDFTFISLYI